MTAARRQVRLHINPASQEHFTVALPATGESFVLGRKGRGRLVGVDVAVPDRNVSRRHCSISWDGDRGWTLRDLYSVNGTTLNGEIVRGPVPIPADGEILIGTTRIRVAFDGVPEAAVPDSASTAPPEGGGSEATGAVTVHAATEVAATVPFAPAIEEAAATTVTLPSPVPGPDAVSETLAATVPAPAMAATTLPAPHPAPARAEADEDAGVANAHLDDDSPTLSLPTPRVAGAAITAAADTADAEAGRLQTPSPAPRPEPPRADAEAKSIPDPGQTIRLKGIALSLVNANLLDASRAESLLRYARETGRTFFRAVADDDTVRLKDEIYKLVAKEFGLPTIDHEATLREEAIGADWLPHSLAESRGVLLLEPRTDSTTRVATIDPFDITIDDWVTRCTGWPVEKILVAPTVLFNAINRLKSQVTEEDKDEFGVAIDITMDQERQLRGNLDNVDAPQIVNYFLHRGFVQGASDIHVEPTEDSLLARNRVDGILHVDTTLPLHLRQEIVSRIKIMSGMDVAEKRRPQDGRIGAAIRGAPIDVRVSSYPTVYGEKIVMRLLDKNALRPSPETLGLMANDLQLLKDKIGAPYGLIMISGPTGSGKTTTLYSCLGSIDRTANNVLTIEDPVEYRLKGVHQLQVNEKIGLTFASGLRTILRQDPDVIMVGECRDRETAAMAIQASLTGHIVFSTIHTNDAVGVVTRLLDMEIDPFLVANALSLAVAQRLVRRVCRHCKTSVSGADVLRALRGEGVSEARQRDLGIHVDPDLLYVKGAGCVHCRNTGYQGRQAVFEMFEMTREARALIMSDRFNADELSSMAMKNGMTNVMSHGLHLVDEGETTHDEVMRVLGEKY